MCAYRRETIIDGMAHPVPRRSVEREPEEWLARLLVTDPPAFALLHRPESSTGPEAVDVLIGEAITSDLLSELPLEDGSVATGSRHELLALLPFRQIRERGFACVDDGEPIRSIVVREQGRIPLSGVLRGIPNAPLTLYRTDFTPDEATYGATVQRVIDEDIGRGEGSNFVMKRTCIAEIVDYSPCQALKLFRRLLLKESGAYWTFIVHTGDRTFVGATPERHVTLDGGTLAMNPISGTLRYPPTGPHLDEVMKFLADRKETEELCMVVDEELKMMAKICESGGSVSGPYLKEMARLAHTEYLITGRSLLDPRQILRETMFAPTVTGSPLENACRVIARREPTGRGYYSGALALMGRDRSGRSVLDSSILIRTADITRSGHARIGVGATLVRLSDPAAEITETHTKAAGMLSALSDSEPSEQTTDAGPEGGGRPRFARHPRIRSALATRNATLARYWLTPESARDYTLPQLAGRRILIVDAEDTFTAMLAQFLRGLGLVVAVHPYDAVPELKDWDLVVVGPGPGDPLDVTDPRIVALHSTIEYLLHGDRPFLTVCLAHQVLAARLGLEVRRREVPNQGVQGRVDLFGRPERVGFYNTFSAHCLHETITSSLVPDPIEVSRDDRTGVVHALRGTEFASVQFHPESLLTQHGSTILSDLITHLVRPGAHNA